MINPFRLLGCVAILAISLASTIKYQTSTVKIPDAFCKEPMMSLELGDGNLTSSQLEAESKKFFRALQIDNFFVITYWALFCGMALELRGHLRVRKLPLLLAGLLILFASLAAYADWRENRVLLKLLKAGQYNDLIGHMVSFVFWKWFWVYLALLLISILFLLRVGMVRFLALPFLASAITGLFGLTRLPTPSSACPPIELAASFLGIGLIFVAILMLIRPSLFSTISTSAVGFPDSEK